jgi:NAD(P)-dependent dehydrogenase (short-subunit alcohol dehydrogenase family)
MQRGSDRTAGMSLDSRVALITGGSRGIGRAIAERLAADGVRVVVTGRSAEDLNSVAASVGGIAVVMDLADRASTDAGLAEIRAQVETVHFLINNAGMADAAPIGRATDETWDRIMEVNITSAFRLSRAFAPAMAKAKYGRIVNVASNAGLTGYAYTHAYCASKHAMVGLTRSLAVELARAGVTVNAVCPGWVDTQMAHEAIARIAENTGRSVEEARGELAGMSPQNRLVTPEEVAHVVAMLCHDNARGITGQTIPVDGGQVIK